MSKYFKFNTATQILSLLLIFVLSITFSCNKDDWWRKIKDGGSGTNNKCIDKSKIKPYKICPKVNNPVCGCDGKTYANPCEADKNGVMKYTMGKCKPDNTKDECIDKSKINPNIICAKTIDPVCGCDGKDYSNSCEADKNGVIKYTKGKCNPNGGGGTNDGCFDKTKVDPNRICAKIYEPVCGCDGKDYDNSCEAEKAGLLKYTKGKCNTGGGGNGGGNTKDSCYDKSKVNPNTICPKVYDPVCGCDGVEYGNSCEADKNGIIKYTLGKCKK